MNSIAETFAQRRSDALSPERRVYAAETRGLQKAFVGLFVAIVPIPFLPPERRRSSGERCRRQIAAHLHQ